MGLLLRGKVSSGCESRMAVLLASKLSLCRERLPSPASSAEFRSAAEGPAHVHPYFGDSLLLQELGQAPPAAQGSQVFGVFFFLTRAAAGSLGQAPSDALRECHCSGLSLQP